MHAHWCVVIPANFDNMHGHAICRSTKVRYRILLTRKVHSYIPTPDRYIKANVVPGDAIVVHSLPAGILSLSDVRYYETALSIHHGSWELLVPSEPGVVHSGRWINNGTG